MLKVIHKKILSENFKEDYMLLKYLNLFLQNYFYRKVAKVNPIKNVLSRKKNGDFHFYEVKNFVP